MYEELVKRLRELKEMLRIAQFNEAESLIKEAADAIEELCSLCASQSKDCSEAIAKYIELWEKQPRWIPVTEGLPKAERESYWVCTDTGYQCECRWTNNRFGIEESDEWGWSIFDIPQYQKVVSWMPLPQPPKKET